MPLTITSRSDGEILTAAKYNTDRQTIADGLTPSVIDDYSTSLTQMRTQTDPGESGSESLATGLSGELERMRFRINEISGGTYWYQTLSGIRAQSLTAATLPSAATAGRIAYQNDAGRGLWVDNGTAWVPNNGYALNVEDFGASPSGTASANTTAVQAAFTAAAAVSAGVTLPRMYTVNSVKITNGMRFLKGPGGFNDNGASGEGVLTLDGPTLLSGSSVTNCVIDGITINMANGGVRAIYADRAIACSFVNNYLYGFVDSATADKSGIRFNSGSKQCIIANNRIVAHAPSANRFYGVVAVADTTAYAGYYVGAGGFDVTVEPANPIDGFVIANNYIYGGSHGIFGNGMLRFSITGNTIDSQQDRSIILEPYCRFGSIVGNTCRNFKSSAIHCAYGSAYLDVVGNMCYSTIANGESALQAYLGAQYINYIGNNVYVESGSPAGTNYGIYMAVDVNFCTAIGNTVVGVKRAGIAVESGWDSTLPGGSSYSRNNTTAAVVGSAWGFRNSGFITIKANSIYNPAASGVTAAIYLAQVKDIGGTDYSLTNVIVDANSVLGSSHTQYFMIFEETSGQLTTIKCTNNTWVNATASKFSFTRGRAHFNYIEGNEFLNSGYTRYSFADADATPDVSLGDRFMTANTGATSITNFDGSIAGHVISVRLDVNTTIVHDNAKIRLKGDVNIVPGDADNIVSFENLAGVWYERSRSF